jgi:co-chaperonin GroES (HSP10)
MPASAIKSVPVHDPKREILDKLGDLSTVEIAHNEVLLAIYRRPEKTAGGIILTHNNLKEDVYQGKVGLVVKIGPGCTFPNVKVELHDWVVARPSDTWALDINGHPDAIKHEDFVPCRLVFDDQIRMRVAFPATIW